MFIIVNEGIIHQILKKLFLWNMLKKIINFFILIIVLISCIDIYFLSMYSIKLILILI